MYFCKLLQQYLNQVKEKIKQFIKENLLRKTLLKLDIRNLDAIGGLTDEHQNEILDNIKK